MRGFIGIDIETTGLDPKTDQILEIAVVLFNEKLESNADTQIIAVDRLGVKRCHDRLLDQDVRNMHRESGLLDEIDQISLDDAGDPEAILGFVQMVASWHAMLGGKQPMLGSSVHFDREFLKIHLPELEATFSHRNIDASSLREYAKVVDPDKYAEFEATLEKKANHRAIDDVMASAELIKRLAAETWVAR